MPDPGYVRALAEILKRTKAPQPLVQVGEIALAGRRSPRPRLNYNEESWELLQRSHDYVLDVGGDEVELSAQLYRNNRDHHRLFAFSRCRGATGMLFSLNFTTEKAADGMVSLSQKLRFAEGRGKKTDEAKSIRQAKARLLADMLLRSGFEVTDNLEVDLGVFSAKTCKFISVTPQRFISQFFGVALLKGHLQGNKGFQLAALPRFDDSFTWKWNSSDRVRTRMRPGKQGRSGARAIPLALRFQVLERDRGRCCACKRGPRGDVTLHVDHVTPYSLGGLTVLGNLQTLCHECNLGKGNRSRLRFPVGR